MLAALLGAFLVMPATAASLGADTEPTLLPAEQAFRFSARVLDTTTIEARFDVADGYYLYRDKLAFAVAPAAPVKPAELPAGVRKHDAFFGDVATLRGHLAVRVPVGALRAGEQVTFRAELQGCADVGVCYPVGIQQVTLSVPAAGKGPGPVVDATRKRQWFN